MAEVCADDMYAARVASPANAVTGALWAAVLGVSAIDAGLALVHRMLTKHHVKKARLVKRLGRLPEDRARMIADTLQSMFAFD